MNTSPPPNVMLGLLRSLIVVGSANLVSVALGVIRIKIMALLFGAAGVGLWGIFSNLLNVLSNGAGLGIPTSAVRQIATSPDDEKNLSIVSFTVSVTILLQGIGGVGLVVFFKDALSNLLFQNSDYAYALVIVAVGALFAMMTLAKMSILQGQREIALMSKATVLGAVAGTVLGIGILLSAHPDGIVLFILAQPVCGFLFMAYFVRKTQATRLTGKRVILAFKAWKALVWLGIPLMLGVFIQMLSLLFVRALVTQNLGLAEAGLFAASWTIAMHYIGFLFNAMGADYYPRLSSSIKDPSKTQDLINRQIQLGLILGTPVLIAMVTLSPWIVAIFYTQEFSAVSDVLQWQLLGNIFKLISWPMAFVLIATERSKTFLAGEILWNGLFLALVLVGLPHYGLLITGIGFAICYCAYFVFLLLVLQRLVDFKMTRLSVLLSVWACVATSALLIWSICGAPYIVVVGFLLAICALVIGLAILAQQMENPPRVVMPNLFVAKVWAFLKLWRM